MALVALLLLAPSAHSGEVELAEALFTVQEKARVEWIYTVGDEGFEPGDELRLDDPVFHGMTWSKWGVASPWVEACTPQQDGQVASVGWLSARAQRGGQDLEDVTLGLERDGCDPHSRSCDDEIHSERSTTLFLQGGGSLQPGDSLHLLLGDQDGCHEQCQLADCSGCDDCGFEMPDRAFPAISWPSWFCPGGGDCQALESVELEVQAEAEPATLLVTAPGQVVLGQEFTVKAALLDSLGNPVAGLERDLQLAGGGLQASTVLSPDNEGWHDFTLQAEQTGILRLAVDAGEGLVGDANPIEVLAEAPALFTYWGDLHAHHGYTIEDSDGVPLDLNHVYARDVAGLDVVAESLKAEGVEIDDLALWESLQQGCSVGTVEGSFLVLLAFEWMGDLAADELGTTSDGHHNVYFDRCDGPYGTHDLEQIDSLEGLWAWLELQPQPAVSVPHATRFTGSDFSAGHQPRQAAVEVYSEWGDGSSWEDDDAGSSQDWLSSGLRGGWIASSDNHDGWMGNPVASRNVSGGLAALLAPELSRAAIFEALSQGRSYATTGHRPLLEFAVADSGVELLPGQEYLPAAPSAHWRYHGTAELERVALYAIAPAAGAQRELLWEDDPDGLDAEGQLALAVADLALWLEVEQQDGEKAWSSPVWLSTDCARLESGASDPLGICSDDTGEPTPGSRCGCRGDAAMVLLPLTLLGWRRRWKSGGTGERCRPPSPPCLSCAS